MAAGNRARTPRIAVRVEVDRQQADRLAAALQPWFLAEQRDLAWRRTTDPYAIWVSEIMLQQTRVETVERYYPEFLRRFPSVETLAEADEQAVLQAWSGLGYYRRARLLHRGARYVAGVLNGSMPSETEALRKIPGVGRYTAGAIASIAFDRPAALVDGNVARVFSRILGLADSKEQGADAPVHWAWADAVIGAGRPRVLAQALMELGATVCTPKAARCESCPVRTLCKAHADGLVDVIPAPRKKVEQPIETLTAIAVVHARRLLLVRRPAEGLLADMWCLPLSPADKQGRPQRTALGVAFDAARLGRGAGPLPMVRHVFTHRIWEMHPMLFEPTTRVEPRDAPPDRIAWIAAGERPPGGMPNVTEKLLERLGF